MTLSGIPAHLLARAAADPRNAHASDLLRRLAGEAPQTASGRVQGREGEEGAREAEKVTQRGGSAATGARKRGGKEAKVERDGSSSLRLTFYGAPRTKKNSAARLSHKGRPSIVPSSAWMRWRDECLKQVWPWMRLRDQRYNVAADFYRDADRGDATGYFQGLADVLQECGIVSNDRWLVTWNGSRLLVDREHPRVEISISPAGRTSSLTDDGTGCYTVSCEG